MTTIEIGRLLRAGIPGFVVGVRVNQINLPSFGALVRVPLMGSYQVFGLIHDIHIDDDGLVRQLVTADSQAQVVHLRPFLQGQAVADVVAAMKAVPAAVHLRPLPPAPVDAVVAAAHQAVPLRLFHHADRF